MFARFLFWLDSFLENFLYDPLETKPQDLPMNKEPTHLLVNVEDKKTLDILTPKYVWTPPDLARHSVRVICDEEGLTVEEKNTLDATIGGESGWHIDAVNKNINPTTGKVTSVDYGICQWNNYWHGKEISPDEALHNPEKAVRLMCAYWKRGQRDLWIAYKNGSYKKYL